VGFTHNFDMMTSFFKQPTKERQRFYAEICLVVTNIISTYIIHNNNSESYGPSGKERFNSRLTQKTVAHEVTFLAHCSNRSIESNLVARRRRGNAIGAVCGYLQHVLLTTSNERYKSNMFDRSNKLRATSNELILVIENIGTRGNFVAFHKIACNEQEKLPRVLRALWFILIER
jgi:hypothetical protein